MSRDANWVSDELREALWRLTAQQARGVLRIVQAELEGRTLASLLDCEDQICTSTTYYGSGKRVGWRQKPEFQKAIKLARRDYRQWMLQHGVEDALLILTETAPHAARALRQQVIGDDAALQSLIAVLDDDNPELRRKAAAQIGLTGNPSAVPAVQEALTREDDPLVRAALVDALGHVAGLRDSDRREAAESVLDRADIKTAAKQALGLTDDDLNAAIERELARMAGSGQDAASGEAEGNADAQAV